MDIPNLNKNVIYWKVYHFACLICGVHAFPATSDGMKEVPLPLPNVYMSVHNKCLYTKAAIRDLSNLCGIEVYDVEKSYTCTELAVWTTSWSRDNGRHVEFYSVLHCG